MESAKSIAQELSEALTALEFHNLPDPVVEFSRVAFLDWIGAALAGSHEESVNILLQVIPPTSDSGEATILPAARKGLALFAALVNGAASHATEMDDFHKTSMVHLGVTVIPAVLALAEKVRATGKEFITSLIVGFEAGIRVGEAVNPSHWEFWHPSGTCGTFAALAGCGRVLRLTPQEMAHGFGIAGTQAAGFRFYEGMNKHPHPGKAAMNGMLAALLAQRRFTGDTHIFEGETGFCRAMAKESKLEKLTAALPLVPGNFRSLENSYKPHASCRHTHPAIDAALKIVKNHPLGPDEVKAIYCRTYSAATRLLNDPTVRDAFSAKFSLPYCIALAIKEKKVGLHSFSPSLLWNKEMRRLMERTSVEVDPTMEKMYPEKWPAEVEIVTGDGKRLKERVDYPKGDPESPMSLAEVVEKYQELASIGAGEATVKLILDRVMSLEEVPDMSAFFEGFLFKGDKNAGS
ncbi:MAG: MmgE/PrpD family protein [Deltaproteobacteria bacterium]|nr:MmgE/PrpD family protein [Deltaproteobacteria bacterium]